MRTATVALVSLSASVGWAQVKLLAVGDVLFDRGVRTTLASTDLGSAFLHVAPLIAQHDLVFCNLECPLTTPDTGHPLFKRFSFRCDPSVAKALRDAGFDLVSVANNHTIDWGREGFVDTIRFLRRAGLHPVGGGHDQAEAMRPAIVERGGLTFAVFGALAFLLEGITHLEDKPGPALAGIDRLQHNIERVRNLVDFVIVSFHWGIEDNRLLSSRQMEFAHGVVDAGADLVLGHHPHVLQGVEHYRGRWIVYSLGNFLFDSTTEHRSLSMALSCGFSKGQIGELEISPVEVHRHLPRPATASVANQVFQRLASLSSSLNTDLQWCGNTICARGRSGSSGAQRVPVKQWDLGGTRLRAYTSRLHMVTGEPSRSAELPIDNPDLYIRDACLVPGAPLSYVYAVVGPLSGTTGSRLAIFPVNVSRVHFATPILDAHLDLRPWRIRCADVDGDGRRDVLAGVRKPTRFDPNDANRLFVFDTEGGGYRPKWLGSSLGQPFSDFETRDSDDDGRSEVLVLERPAQGNAVLAEYEWNGFGFDRQRVLDANATRADLIAHGSWP